MGLFSRSRKSTQAPSPPPPHPTTLPSPSAVTSEKHRAPSSPTESTTSSWSRATRATRPSPSVNASRNPFRTATSPPASVRSGPLGVGGREQSSSQGSWDDAGVPVNARSKDSPDLAPPNRYAVFGGGRASSSTVSLPSMVAERQETTPRMRQTSAMAPVVEQEQEKGRFSLWKGKSGSGNPPKQRRGSTASFRLFEGVGLGVGGGNAASEEGGFVVTSFRSVSRVQEDPVSRVQSPTAPPAPTPLPASAYSTPSDDLDAEESLRNSVDYSNAGPRSGSKPRRPSLNTLGNSQTSSSHAWERAPSPTITADAFRRSARSQSTLSLVSLSRDSEAISPPSETARPKFEPQRPSSRTSRRGSTYSEMGSASPSNLQPPRPSFIGQHSNGSKTSMHSRTSSSGSVSSNALGVHGLPQPAHPSTAGRTGLVNSDSLASVNSYTTAQEGSRTTSPIQTRRVSPVSRPALSKRLSSADSELRLIAAYGDSFLADSPPCDSPVELPPSSSTYQSRFTFSTPTLASPPLSTPRKTSPASSPTSATTPTATRLSSGPSFSVQPPTPVSAPAFSIASGTRPKRSSSLAPDAVKDALQKMGVGKGAASQKQQSARKGWVDSSDEEEEEEILEPSDSDSDDEVPLSQIRSRSQLDLAATLRSDEARHRRPSTTGSSEVEVLEDAPSVERPSLAGTAGGATLARVGSNRRSMSTLSFSTSLAASQATARAPPSPTTSILNRPHFQSRSVSNPSTPSMPSFSTSLHSSAISTAGTPALSPLPSPAFRNSSQDRSSSSSLSGSGTGSSSSAPVTPHDMSPAASTLGYKLSSPGPPSSNLGSSSSSLRHSVKFDPVSLASNTEAQRDRRMSGSGNSNLSSLPPLRLGGPQHHRSTPSLPTFAQTRLSSSQSSVGAARPSFLGHAASTNRFTGSSLGTPSPLHSRATSAVTAGTSTPGTSPSIHALDQNSRDRMKARHRSEALEALKIGRDLNNPTGQVPERADGEESEDDDEPLASLPTRGGGSVMGGFGGGGGGGGDAMSSMGMAGMQQQQQQQMMGMGMGGAYSPLAMAPPGVDPYLYASLPPDQKMSLHQRAQHMMSTMQQAALQARAESVAGSALGMDGGSMLGGYGGGGGNGQGVRPSASMTGLDQLGGGGGEGGGYGHQHTSSMSSMQYGFSPDPYAHLQRGNLPAFAPSFNMSQQFFQHPAQQYQQSMYGGMQPHYAGSAMGYGGGGGGGPLGSMLGVPPSQKKGGGRAASTIGMPVRRGASEERW